MIIESVKHGPFIRPTIEENGVTRTMNYEELSATEKIQADCDLKTTNIILQGQQRVVKCFNFQGEGHMARQCLKPKRKRDATWFRDKVLLVEAQGSDDLDVYDSDCDDFSTAKAVLMANLSIYGLDVLNQSVPIFLALGFHNPFYLKKAQQIRPMLYDGSVIAKETNTLHPNTDQSASSPVKIEAPRELPKTNLVNTSLKKLKYHLGQFDSVVKKQITPDALTEGEWGFEHTKDIVNIVVNSSMDMNTSLSLSNITTWLKKDEYNRLLKSFSKLKQHRISLELTMQLNKEIFQKNNTSVNQIEPTFDYLFELNNLKAELQAKDTTIEKLKANIKRLNKTSTTNYVKKNIDEIETINIELKHRVAKLIAENKHLKQTYKQLYDSIKPSREKVLVITTLKNNHRKVKGKDIVDNAAQVSNATTTTLRSASSKTKSVKKAKKKEEWKSTGKVFTKIGYNWRPTGRTFTLVRNVCPLTRITTTNKVPFREPISLEVVTQEFIVTKVYTRIPKVVQIVLWYLDSGCSKHMIEDRSQLTNFVHKFLGTVKFGNDQIVKIMGYVTNAPTTADLANSPVSTSIDQDAPSTKNVMLIKLKWIYKVKMNKFDGVLKNKARLVAQRFRQEDGIDLEKTFAPVVKPIEKLLNAVKRIFRYLKETINIGLWYSKDTDMSLIAYSNADHARCQDTRRSTSGSTQFLGDKLVNWSSKQQKSTAISSTEAEYDALSGCCAQIL
uniref:Uncharacterized mitochondrial protein AtMg00810-like n=1 Tax=Tanacetum cinerariifolium TaxID=118510 RepID=A0A699HA85_TANCI|nr:uncharacterized mitochondrial protein AtMg00810-like [Tanacetum cinerariifolium]